MTKEKETLESMKEKVDNIVCKEMKAELTEILKKQPNHTIKTDEPLRHGRCDVIYGYVIDESWNDVVEKQITEIRLENEEMIVVFDSNEDDAYPLFGGEVFSIFTMYNIAEFIDEYLPQK